MNNNTTDFNSGFDGHLDKMTEQDMFAIAQQMNMIEPGTGSESVSFAATLMEAAPSMEISAIIGALCVGLLLAYPAARKMRLARLIRLHF